MNRVEVSKSISMKGLSDEDKRNLVEFFELLIKVDKRNNPENYTL